MHEHCWSVALLIPQLAVGHGSSGKGGIAVLAGGAGLAQSNSQVLNQLREMSSALLIAKRKALKNPSIRIDARGVGVEFRATPVTDAKAVKSVIERFREKYGAKDVKKYYSTFDVAVSVELG
jgi:hypothetical protein